MGAEQVGNQGRVLCVAGGDASLSGGLVDFVDPESIGVLLFTSGTTFGAQGGRAAPPAPRLLHHHQQSSSSAARADEAQLICVPPYHIAGVAAVLSSLYFGAAHHVPADLRRRGMGGARRRPSSITHAMVVPTMLGRILDAVESTGVGGCRRCATCRTGAGACPWSWSSGRAGNAPGRPGQRLRADRDVVDHRHARRRTTTGRPSGLQRSGGAGPAGLGGAAVARPWRSRWAGARTTWWSWGRGERARSGCAANRWPASTWGQFGADRGRLVPDSGRRVVRRARLLVRRRAG